jgi:Fe-S-cluster containining protein
MRDGPLRRALKLLALARFVIDVRVTRAIWRGRGDWPYGLGGACRRHAACCEAPAIQVGRLVWYLPSARWAFLAWHRHVNGFVLREIDAGSRAFVFRCTHFDAATRACDSYDTRPGMCRDYPRALLFHPFPEMLPGCGYRPIAPNAARLRQALEDHGVPAETRQRLARALNLEE